jgi:hypothetical protein
MTEEAASLILELLRQMRAELATKDNLESVRAEVSGVRSEVADIKSDVHTLRADVAADILTTRKELGEQIVGLRQTVIDYQAMALRVCPSLLRFHASAAAQQHDGVGP